MDVLRSQPGQEDTLKREDEAGTLCTRDGALYPAAETRIWHGAECPSQVGAVP